MTPRILAVSLSPKHGFCKKPQEAIRLIAGEGVEDDAHRGVTTQHLYLKRKDPTQRNLCQVHLLAREKLDELSLVGFLVQPGELGENLLTEGIDLHGLPKGARLQLGAEAVVEITGLRTPCSQIDAYRSGLQAQMWRGRDAAGKRVRDAGVMGVVCTGGMVRTGDAIRTELPPGPHVPLGPV